MSVTRFRRWFCLTPLSNPSPLCTLCAPSGVSGRPSSITRSRGSCVQIQGIGSLSARATVKLFEPTYSCDKCLALKSAHFFESSDAVCRLASHSQYVPVETQLAVYTFPRRPGVAILVLLAIYTFPRRPVIHNFCTFPAKHRFTRSNISSARSINCQHYRLFSLSLALTRLPTRSRHIF